MPSRLQQKREAHQALEIKHTGLDLAIRLSDDDTIDEVDLLEMVAVLAVD